MSVGSLDEKYEISGDRINFHSKEGLDDDSMTRASKRAKLV